MGQGGARSLSALTGLTIFDVTYDAGYGWQGMPLNPPMEGGGSAPSGGAFIVQNLSLLATPDADLVVPNCVSSGASSLAYEKYGHVPKPGVVPPYNFYLDTSTDSPNLRVIDLSAVPGTYTVSPTPPSWGQFPNLTTLDRLVVHQSGVAVGLSTEYHKLAILRLPKTGSTPTTPAPTAQLCSGLGTRQGLMNTPVAMDIAPDGTILILEAGNHRVQAFDHHGNPVAAFDSDKLFAAPAVNIPYALDKSVVPATLQDAFQANGINLLFQLDASDQSLLVAGKVSASLMAAFQDAGGILLSGSAWVYVVTTSSGATNWQIVDKACKQMYQIPADSSTGALNVFSNLYAPTVTILTAGSRWIVADTGNARSYDVVYGGDQIHVFTYVSTFKVDAPVNAAPTYYDLAVDITGYIYVMYYDDSGTVLDIYTPGGKFVTRAAGVGSTASGPAFVAGKIALDIWRNLYALDFQLTEGPNGQLEPTISQWLPTPPVGQLAASFSADFVAGNVAAITTAMQNAGIKTPGSFTVATISAAGHWQIVSGSPVYDVILSPAVGATGALLYFYAAAAS
jgi:hypothetical protein